MEKFNKVIVPGVGEFYPWTTFGELNTKTEEIKDKIESTQPDLSSVAKQGTNTNATNTAILDAIVNLDEKLEVTYEEALDELNS